MNGTSCSPAGGTEGADLGKKPNASRFVDGARSSDYIKDPFAGLSP